MKHLFCPVCAGNSMPLDVVDFNKSCEENRDLYLPISGIPIYYYLCENCSFCFAPEICEWDLEAFANKIYNAKYEEVDPEYKTVRPEGNARELQKIFKDKQQYIKHLDYGGGNGTLSNLLKESGWNSTSYDPFVNDDTELGELGGFNLITAYEVFEHVPDVNQLMQQLRRLLTDDGIILFSTYLSDGHIQKKQRLSWWYASPRNGHISIFSKSSIKILSEKHGMNVGSFNENFHVLFNSLDSIPDWSSHLFSKG